MRLATYLVFDQSIAGLATTYYSSAQLHRQLGEADAYAVQAYTTNVSGGPTLKVQPEYSADGQNWLAVAPPDISTTISSGTSVAGTNLGVTTNMPTAYVRLAISFTAGASPSCNLKLFFTGHTRSLKS
jgi:hypothetical protein